MNRNTLLVVALVCLLSALPAASQTITATLEAVVVDSTGAVIPGAVVTVTNTATNVEFATETNSAGRFLAPSLQPGPYTVIVEAPGFKRVERSGLVLEVEQTARIQITMEVGAVSETIEVSAEAPLLEATNHR